MIKKYQFESEPADSMTLRQIALWAAFPACAVLVLAGGIALNIDQAPEAEPLVEVASAAEAPAAAIAPAQTVAKTERPVESVALAEVESTPQPLDETDPRWGGDVTAAAEPSQTEETAFGAQGDADPLPANDTDDLGAALAASAIDEDTTAAIGGPPGAGPEVVVAESDQEVAALEQAAAARQDQLPDAAFVSDPNDAFAALDAQDGSTSSAASSNADTSGFLPGQTTEYVNFRTGPSNDAETISIVPGGTALTGQPIDDCVHFCAVEIDGQQGYIYKSFIEYAAAPDETQAEAQTQAQAPAEPLAEAPVRMPAETPAAGTLSE